MRRLFGFLVALVGSWMLISPQALLGLKQLKWMYKYAFAGEVLIGIVVIGIAYNFLDLKPKKEIKASH